MLCPQCNSPMEKKIETGRSGTPFLLHTCKHHSSVFQSLNDEQRAIFFAQNNQGYKALITKIFETEA